jgi:Family of unknown function (DUF5990)
MPATSKSKEEVEVRLRIVVEKPPRDVVFCVQGKLGEFLSPTISTGKDITFEVSMRAAPGPRFLGPITQGPPTARFVYVCSGTCAGDARSCWTRRAKLPLATITQKLVEQAKKGAMLEARIAGTAKDGGPACATVPLLGGGWRVAGTAAR